MTSIDESGRAAQSSVLVSMREIEKRYGAIRALREVNIDIRALDVHAIVGDNGAGKSTLIKILAGAIKADGGQVYVDGVEAQIGSPQAATRLGIATVYQHLALVDSRTVAENVFMGREPGPVWWVDRRRMSADAESSLRDLEIANVGSVETEVASLSGGQRQAVAIARAIREGARILVLDEPTAALGVRESRNVLDLIKRLKQRHVTVVLVSHDLPEVFEVADRITVLRAGSVVGTRDKVTTTLNEIVSFITGASIAAEPQPV